MAQIAKLAFSILICLCTHILPCLLLSLSSLQVLEPSLAGMPPSMKKTTQRQSGARGRSTTPASSRASKSVASRASKSSVSASRSRARTGGGKPSKSVLGTAAARSSTVVGRAAQKRDADDTARGSKLKTMRRPAADAAEGLEEPEEEGPVESEAEEFPSPADIDDAVEPSPFLDARRGT